MFVYRRGVAEDLIFRRIVSKIKHFTNEKFSYITEEYLYLSDLTNII